jgi:hypothetical protein
MMAERIRTRPRSVVVALVAACALAAGLALGAGVSAESLPGVTPQERGTPAEVSRRLAVIPAPHAHRAAAITRVGLVAAFGMVCGIAALRLRRHRLHFFITRALSTETRLVRRRGPPLPFMA